MGASMNMMKMDTSSAPAPAPVVAPEASWMSDRLSEKEIDLETVKLSLFWENQNKKDSDVALQNNAYRAMQTNQTLWTLGIVAASILFMMFIAKRQGTKIIRYVDILSPLFSLDPRVQRSSALQQLSSARCPSFDSSVRASACFHNRGWHNRILESTRWGRYQKTDSNTVRLPWFNRITIAVCFSPHIKLYTWQKVL
jgi:hypothetical protein